MTPDLIERLMALEATLANEEAELLRDAVTHICNLETDATPTRTHSDESWRRRVASLETQLSALQQQLDLANSNYAVLETNLNGVSQVKNEVCDKLAALQKAYDALREHMMAEKRCDFVEHTALQQELTLQKKLYSELLMSFHWAENEVKRVRDAAFKVALPWINGNIGFDEWCKAVDAISPPETDEQKTARLFKEKVTSDKERGPRKDWL